MAAGTFDEHRSIDDPAGTGNAAGVDKISELPDDVLLDILGRLFTAGHVRTAASTSILSRRWRSLPWPEMPRLSLDVGDFLSGSDDNTWRVVRGRHRFWRQHHATAAFTAALARFLAAPASKRIVEHLSLTFILTRRDYVCRIGDLLAGASASGVVKNSVELKIVTEMSFTSSRDALTMIGYGERFVHFFKDCPGAFRRVTKLSLEYLWFEDEHALRDLVRGCDALEFLSLKFCALLRPPLPDADVNPLAVLAVYDDAPRLKTLVCDGCLVDSVEVSQAPALVELQLRWLLDIVPPVSFGCAPLLKSLSLRHHPRPVGGEDDDMMNVKWKLSELLARDGGQIETLLLDFENDKIWFQPEGPRRLRAALGELKELHLTKIPAGYNLSWALFLLEASPLLESLEIHIFDHICRGEWRKKHRENTDLTWQPSPGFMHLNLKKLTFQRAFNVYKDMPFARLIMELAVNLETLTFGVETLECKDCVAAEPNFPDPARSRLRLPGNSEHVDAVVKKLKDGISTSVQITIHLPD
ncbi:hypothetical protein HU200_040041 [Digitaria exilis]|uniref:F-box domain-containing protein n=1 Tax=Digitaria exilis TaxID=1010633 RepID=A0A835EHQ1_9POAL|nr:hypothetical protein HU200_040041 [Digitaria exilis]